LPFAVLKDLSKRVAPLNWHLELLVHANEFPEMAQNLGQLHTPIVLGHLGYVSAEHTLKNRGFQNLLSMVRAGHAWVKLTGPYRISQSPTPPYHDVTPFAQALLNANPNRLLWGTDWPHVMVKGEMPNDATLLNLLFDWIPNPADQEKIFVKNPAALYGFVEE